MRVLIDTNSLNSSELICYFAGDSRRKGVLADPVGLESCNVSNSDRLIENLSTLSCFQDRLLLLKGVRRCAALDAAQPQIAKRMVDVKETARLSELFDTLKRARLGDPASVSAAERHRQRAARLVEEMRSGVGNLEEQIAELETAIHLQDLKDLRCGRPASTRMRETIWRETVSLSHVVSSHHPSKPTLPLNKRIVDHFIFRFSLAINLFLLRFIEHGTRSTKDGSNFCIDALLSCSATYFNGIMTDDYELGRNHAFSRHILRLAGAKLFENYQDDLRMRVLSACEHPEGAAACAEFASCRDALYKRPS